MSARPAEDAAWQAQQDQAAQAAAQCAQGNLNHEAEVMSHHQGAPSIAVQNATHGVPAPPPDPGPAVGSVI